MEDVIHYIKKTAPDFPELLSQIQDPPEGIFYKGASLGNEPKVAIVGTRKATGEGKKIAREMAHVLGARGFTIVSGMALGIDAEAHWGALESGAKTIAVLACGLNITYPRVHASLQKRILNQGGAIVSEYPENTEPFPNHFLERNRIVSGLSHAVIIIQAPIHSGSITTGRRAIEQGREVYVIPGTVYTPQFEGSHMLIREGARLVRNADDVLEDIESLVAQYPELASLAVKNQKQNSSFTRAIEDPTQREIVECLRSAEKAISVQAIIETTGVSAQAVSRNLTLLMLSGLILEVHGKYRLAQEV